MQDIDKYKFNLSDPDSWSKMPVPTLPKRIAEETQRIGGMKSGKPRFRWVWGMSEEVFIPGEPGIPEGWYLKYQLCSNKKTVGYEWMEDGNWVQGDIANAPAGAVICPIEKIEQIGDPHWFLEEWKNEGEAHGVYDRAGYYFLRKIEAEDVAPDEETNLRPYREPNNADLDILRHYVQLTATITDAEIKQGVKDQRAQEAADKQQKRDEVKEGIAETLMEVIPTLPRLPKPSKAVIDRAWAQLEGN